MTRKPKRETCVECIAPPAWIHHTQFAGSHLYCDEHALQQPDFGKCDSYGDWESLCPEVHFASDD